MFKKIGIILLFVVAVWARHAVPIQGLPLLSDTAFADSYTQDGKPCPPECVSDSMEIITYYPSPYGYYEELRGDKIIVGDSDNSYINETDLPPKGTITFEPMLDDPDSSDGNLYEGSLYYQGAIGGTKGKFRFYDGLGWQDLGGGGDYWKPSTANTDDIYYNAGNVGIGVGESVPVGAKLQINMSAGTTGLVVKSAFEAAYSSVNFLYTGGPQTYVVPPGVTILTIEAYGASGSSATSDNNGAGGLGGKAVGTINVTPGDILNIYVGGSGGWNGGGAAVQAGGSGGGASDVRKGGTALVNRVIVAGGGGGGGNGGGGFAGGGGDGGFNGSAGTNGKCSYGGEGGVQNAGGNGGAGVTCNTGCSVANGTTGSLGIGGEGGVVVRCDGGGGGGGGYYGGGGAGSGAWAGGGGGGSSYVTVTATNISMTSGVRTGNGLIIIAPVEVGNMIEWQAAGSVLGVVAGDGKVGIGTATPEYSLTVNGTAWVTSGSWTGSDLRWKKDIEPLPDNTINRLIKLDTIYYNYNNELFQDMRFPSGRQIGLSAQNVEKQFPELVLTDKDGYKAVAYDKLGAVTIEAIKEQQKEIEQLKESLRAQEERNQEKLRKQQKEIELLKAGRL